MFLQDKWNRTPSEKLTATFTTNANKYSSIITTAQQVELGPNLINLMNLNFFAELPIAASNFNHRFKVEDYGKKFESGIQI